MGRGLIDLNHTWRSNYASRLTFNVTVAALVMSQLYVWCIWMYTAVSQAVAGMRSIPGLRPETRRGGVFGSLKKMTLSPSDSYHAAAITCDTAI